MSFSDYVDAHFALHDRDAGKAGGHRNRLTVETFESNNQVVDSYFAKRIAAGAAITRCGNRSRLHYSFPQELQSVTERTCEALWEVRRLFERATPTLRNRDAEVLAEMAHSITVRHLSALDGGPEGRRERVEKTLEAADEDLAAVGDAVQRMARRNTQIRYLSGMLLGLPVVALAAFLLLWIPDGVTPGLARGTLLATLISGSLGAMVSVMTRLGSRGLSLSDQTSPKIIYILGAFRSLIGGIFGVAFYVLIVAELLPLSPPGGTAATFAFYCGSAFIAGFNERWAKDMVDRDTDGSPPDRDSPKPSGP